MKGGDPYDYPQNRPSRHLCDYASQWRHNLIEGELFSSPSRGGDCDAV